MKRSYIRPVISSGEQLYAVDTYDGRGKWTCTWSPNGTSFKEAKKHLNRLRRIWRKKNEMGS